MTFWRNIASLAARRVDAAECADCPPGPPGQDPAFSTAVTALGAKLARADGRADAGLCIQLLDFGGDIEEALGPKEKSIPRTRDASCNAQVAMQL